MPLTACLKKASRKLSIKNTKKLDKPVINVYVNGQYNQDQISFPQYAQIYKDI